MAPVKWIISYFVYLISLLFSHFYVNCVVFILHLKNLFIYIFKRHNNNYMELFKFGKSVYDGIIEFVYRSYKKLFIKREYEFDDQEWHDFLKEASATSHPRDLRTLFALILIHNEPSDPMKLWNDFKIQMSEDIRCKNECSRKLAEYEAYCCIALKINIHAVRGHTFDYFVKKYQMPKANVGFEEDEPLSKSLIYAEELISSMNKDQLAAFNRIKSAIENNDPHCQFFLNGPGGSGKTYVYIAVYYYFTAKGKSVICLASTGISATLLPQGRTVHTTFALEIPLRDDSISNIKTRTSSAALRLLEADIFIWDEAHKSSVFALKNVNELLQKLEENKKLFGGKVMLLGGDFRQCLPVSKTDVQYEKVSLSIKFWDQWNMFICLPLKINERVRQALKQKNVVHAEELDRFAKWVLKVGNDHLPKNALGEVELPKDIICDVAEEQKEDKIIEEIFGEELYSKDYLCMKDKIIMAVPDRNVKIINKKIISRIDGVSRTYYSFDKFQDLSSHRREYSAKFLNSLDLPDLPPHELYLKVNSIVMCMRNLAIHEGLCTGTRLMVMELNDYSIKAKILTGDSRHINKIVKIFRITLTSDDPKISVRLCRHQFPLKLAFAITIDKSQGQTFEMVGLDLRADVFDHGQLYLALSRARMFSSLRVLLNEDGRNTTKNIVYKEILNDY